MCSCENMPLDSSSCHSHPAVEWNMKEYVFQSALWYLLTAHSNSSLPQAVQLVCDICLDYNIPDVHLWSCVLQKLQAFGMVRIITDYYSGLDIRTRVVLQALYLVVKTSFTFCDVNIWGKLTRSHISRVAFLLFVSNLLTIMLVFGGHWCVLCFTNLGLQAGCNITSIVFFPYCNLSLWKTHYYVLSDLCDPGEFHQYVI